MNKANEMRMAGNAAMEQNNYEKAIEIYTAALLVSNNTVEEKSLLYSNRSHAYLQSAIASGDDSEADAKLQLALQDANDVIKVRSTWWKGYARAGNIYKHRKEWNCAIFSFNEALALESDLTEVKNCRDKCRWDEIRAEMSGNFMSHGLKEEIKKVNEVHETQFNLENITNNFEKLMESKDPECRANASVFFGVRYLKGIHVPQDMKIGIDLLQEAVDAGSTEAMVELGVFYMEGKAVERNIEKAVELFYNAATVHLKHTNYLGGELDGTTHAQFHIGLCFQDGIGRPLDYCQARRWYEEASESGHGGATNNVAILYAEGLGGEKSLVKAKQFFRLSATQGNRSAMESLAWMFLMEKDLVEAESWYAKALEAGNVHSIQRKNNFYKVLKHLREFMSEMNIPPHSSDSIEVVTASPETNDEANLIEAIETVTKNRPITTSMTAEPNLQFSGPVNNLQLTNPVRIQLVQRHRETLRKMFERSRVTNFSVQLRMEPQKEEKLNEFPDDFKAITLRDMDPHEGAVYKKRFINLLISKDPTLDLQRHIHVVVRDDNVDCINCSFLHLDHFNKTVLQDLSDLSDRRSLF